jgi:hypothetical protein
MEYKIIIQRSKFSENFNVKSCAEELRLYVANTLILATDNDNNNK